MKNLKKLFNLSLYAVMHQESKKSEVNWGFIWVDQQGDNDAGFTFRCRCKAVAHRTGFGTSDAQIYESKKLVSEAGVFGLATEEVAECSEDFPDTVFVYTKGARYWKFERSSKSWQQIESEKWQCPRCNDIRVVDASWIAGAMEDRGMIHICQKCNDDSVGRPPVEETILKKLSDKELNENKNSEKSVSKNINGCEYKGSLNDKGYPHGYGTFIWPDGAKYVGEWQNGQRHGEGLQISDGAKYVGEWQNGQRHGNGIYTSPSGSKYVGEFNNDCKHGKGTYTLDSGAQYIGEWKNQRMCGKGQFTYSDGRVLVGEWKDGEFIEINN